MVGFLYDDFLHIGQACQRLADVPGYRPILSSFYCLADGHVFLVRLVSLLATILAVKIFGDYLKNINIRLPTWSYALVVLHTVVLFPSIYASQLSTSLTFLWAVAAGYLILFNRNWLLMALAILVGFGLRFEAIYYLVIVIGSFSLFKFALSDVKNPFKVLSKGQYSGIAIFLGATFLLSLIVTLFLETYEPPTKVLSVYRASVPFYPSESHIFVQFYALVLYAKNLLLPFEASFFYPWETWISIHKSQAWKWALSSVPLVTILIPATIIFSGKGRRWRILLAGVFLFALTCLIFSLRLRTDWYFQSRQYVGSIFLLFSVLIFIWKNAHFKKIVMLLCLYFAGSTLYALVYHYSSHKSFALWEYSRTEGLSPQVNSLLAKYVPSSDKRLKLYYQNYAMIEEWMIHDSIVARKVWLKSLLDGYLLSKEMDNKGSAQSALKQLLRSESYYSAVACLASPQVPMEVCRKGNRQKNFCRILRSGKEVDYGDVQLRVDPAKFCEELK